MYDRELALEILTKIYQAAQKVTQRFKSINSADEFTDDKMIQDLKNVPLSDET